MRFALFVVALIAVIPPRSEFNSLRVSGIGHLSGAERPEYSSETRSHPEILELLSPRYAKRFVFDESVKMQL